MLTGLDAGVGNGADGAGSVLAEGPMFHWLGCRFCWGAGAGTGWLKLLGADPP